MLASIFVLVILGRVLHLSNKNIWLVLVSELYNSVSSRWTSPIPGGWRTCWACSGSAPPPGSSSTRCFRRTLRPVYSSTLTSFFTTTSQTCGKTFSEWANWIYPLLWVSKTFSRFFLDCSLRTRSRGWRRWRTCTVWWRRSRASAPPGWGSMPGSLWWTSQGCGGWPGAASPGPSGTVE